MKSLERTRQVLDEDRAAHGRRAARIDMVRPIEASTTRLVLFAHGSLELRQGTARMFEAFAEGRFEGAAVGLIRYRRGFLFSASPIDAAAGLHAAILEALRDAEGRIRDVQFVAYSGGALVVRKALVWMEGHDEDHPDPERLQRLEIAQRELATRTIRYRLVLLAGMSRGWSLEGRDAGGVLRTNFYRAGMVLVGRLRALCRLLMLRGSPWRFVLEMERGSPFVTDLRMQWLRMRKNPKVEVVQLLGEEDPLVRVSDHADLAGRRFVLLTLPQRNHHQIRGLLQKEQGGLLTRSIESTLAQLRKEIAWSDVPHETADRSGVVFVMHGIRDNADWPRELRRMVGRVDPRLECITSSYGHFPMLGFVSRARRARNMRWFMDRYVEAMSESRDSQKESVHFVGHSNGTYLLAEGLRTYATLRVDRVAFMASVVPRDYPWQAVGASGRVQSLRNDRGSSDFVVGWFPNFYQLARMLSWRLIRRPRTNDLGNGGFRGFDEEAPVHHENYYFPGGHGAMLTRENLQSIASYVANGTDMATASRLVREPSGLVSLVSRLCWLVWAALLVFVFGGAYWMATLATGCTGMDALASLRGGGAALGWFAFWGLVFETA